MSKKYHLGLDVGSVSLNTVLMDDQKAIVFEDYSRTKGQPYHVAMEVLTALLGKFHTDDLASVSVTGTGGKLLADLLGGVFVNEIIAQTRATSEYVPQARSIIDMGGEDSKLILVSREGQGNLTIQDFAMNTMCAAGTGSFLDQQAHRLGYTIEQFGQEALRSQIPPRIAGRCSVFAKSDMIHLQQGATPDYEIVAGLCHAMIRNLKSNIAKGKKITPPVSFQGGVAANQGVRQAIREIMDLKEGELVVPEHFFSMGAIGAILNTLDQKAAGTAKPSTFGGLERMKYYLANDPSQAKRLDPLKESETTPSTAHRSLDDLPPGEKVEVYLGVDVGSISTNVVLIDADMNVIAREYLMTAGRPLEAIKYGLREVGRKVGDKVKVVGAGTTGSGRYLTGDFIGADIVRNEITAQATAAAAIDPEVDTIFEIGGQDSKFISLENGAIVDFMMNKVCAAGTGSFLEEQAEKLGINIKEEFGHIAFTAQNPVQLGERCTVFMESDLVHYQQQGVDLPDLVAGLCYSIVTNYINKVVEDRRIGRRIFYQGGTAFNRGIVAAFEAVTGQKITVPNHADVTGAIGVALLALRERTWTESQFKGFDLSERQYDISSFECHGCANTCEIRQVTVQGDRPMFYGSRCEKYDVQKKKAASTLPDLFTERTELMLNPPEAQPLEKTNRGVIGLPRTMFFHELMPFFKTFWTALGFETVISEKSNKRLINRGCEVVVSEPCYPTKVGHGHLLDLVDKGVKRIFLPSVVNMLQKNPELKHSVVCPYAQTLTYTVHAAINFAELGVQLVQGPIYFGYGEKVLLKTMTDIAEPLGVKSGLIKKAVKLGLEAQNNFYHKLLDRGREILPTLGPDRLGMVVVSRPYNGFDPGLNLNLSAKLRDLGVVGIPMDFLTLDDPNYHTEARYQFWRYGQKIMAAAEIIRKDPRLYGIFITNFGCGPDSFILHFFRDLMRGKPYLEIEIDEHSSDVGAVTRLEAFLDSLKNVTVPEETQSLLTFRGRTRMENKRKIYIPNMTDHAHALTAAFRACGVESEVLPPSDDVTLDLGRKMTSGKECYPCILTTGDLTKLVQKPDFDRNKTAFFMPSAYGPCRFGQYHRFQRLMLNNLGFEDVPIYSPDQSDEMYAELDMAAGGGDLTRIAWKGLVAVDLLQKALLQTRPYEVNPGEADRVYLECLEEVCRTIASRGNLIEALKRSRRKQEAVPTNKPGSKPIIGVVGEIYVRTNEYSNENAIRAIENFGGEAYMPPFHEWLLYTNETNFAESKLNGRWKQLAGFKITHHFQLKDLHELEHTYKGFLRNFHEPTIQATYDYASAYLHPSFEGEAILSMGKCKDFIIKGASGLVNIMPFTCMPGTIVTALLKRFRDDNNGIPFLNMAFDGQEQTNTLTRLEAFMYQVEQYRRDRMPEMKKAGHRA